MNPSYNNGGVGNATSGGISGVPNAGAPRPVMSTPPQDFQPIQLADDSKKPKKGLIIGGLLIVAVLIVGLVIGLIMAGGKKGGGGTKVIDTNTAFNEAAKYLLFGDMNSDGNIADVELDDAAFVKVVREKTYEEQQTFFDEAKKYTDTLKNSVGGESEDLVYNATDLNMAVAVLDEVSALSYTDILLTSYIKDGASAFQAQSDKLGQVDTGEDATYYTMLEMGKYLISMTKELYSGYSAGNCFVDGGLNSECADALIFNNEDIAKKYNNVAAATSTVRGYVDMLSETIKFDLDEISKELNNA